MDLNISILFQSATS